MGRMEGRDHALRSSHPLDPLPLFILANLLWFGPSSVATAQSFTNVAAEQGVDILVQSDHYGSGVSSCDFDQDGWDDLTFAMSNDSLVFYRNNAGQLERLPSFLYAPGETKHVLWVDHDNDGDLDLSITTYSGTYRLYRNDGAFQFTDVSAEAGLAQVIEHHYGTSWADYDRDGDLDLYVCTYNHQGDTTNFDLQNHLYRNNGTGLFEDVTLAAGVADSIRQSFQSVWLDYDKDGWPDLYVINDRYFRSSMYRNNGDGTFSEVTVETGTGFDDDWPMTASVADFDNDGDLDIYTTNGGTTRRGRLIVNNGDGTFTDEAALRGVDIDRYSWGATWTDIDNDTWQDLYVATSFLWLDVLDNVLYRSQGGSSFVSAPGLFTGDHTIPSYAVARFDLNNDGYAELVTQCRLTYPPLLWMNSGGTNHYIKVTLQGTVSNRMAIGSWIRVYTGGNCYTQYTLCGENYLGQNSQHHIFGLGEYTLVDSVQVEYVSGHTDTYYQLEVDQRYSFTEGDTYHASITALGDLEFCAGDSVILDAGEHAQYLWSDGSTNRFLTVLSSGTYSATVQNEFGVVAQSDTIGIVLLPAPLIEANTQNPLCAGGGTGSITLNNLTGIAAQEVLWNTGAEGAELVDLPAGTYSYVFTDTNGCTANGQLQLTEPPALFVQATSTPVVTGNDGTIEVQVFGGVPPYVISLNGNSIASPITDLPAGTYDLLVTDAHGCTYSEAIVVDNTTGIANVAKGSFRLFPNPVDDRLTFTCATPLRSIHVIDPRGRVVLTSTRTTDRSLDVSTLDPGHYVLCLVMHDGAAAHAPFIKLAGTE